MPSKCLVKKDRTEPSKLRMISSLLILSTVSLILDQMLLDMVMNGYE